MNWQRYLKGKLKKKEYLARHTSLRIGGPAQFWFEPDNLSALRNLVELARRKKLLLRIIGAGSNILVNDQPIKGIVVKLDSSYFKKVTIKPHSIRAGAGVSLAQLVRRTQKRGLSGFELLAGIPGTVGGALIMNAGNIGDKVLDITVMDKQGRVKILNKKDTRFSYRGSNLNGYIILNANFRLIKKDKRIIAKSIKDYLNYRRKTQDLTYPSAGCFFKNPNEKSAAYFIERAGLKGSSFGDAAVSFKHANFIINKGRASFVDVLRLARYISRSVNKRFNLNLQPEIKIWK
ncbi:MAG: UDP-N-acetylmuramate dehydrogenase [Candidatus Omnitrophota bacterium]|jgi:UDP-N-acetylmuramate dehydrogenase